MSSKKTPKENADATGAEVVNSTKRPVFVGLDDGHYAIKGVREDGSTFSVLSRATLGRQMITIGGGADDAGLYTTEEGKTFTVSDHLTKPEDTRFNDYPKSELNRVLIHHALLAGGFGGTDVNIVTGLPFNHFYMLDGQPNQVLINAKNDNVKKGVFSNVKTLANIVSANVSTEAIAAYIDLLMDIDGNETADYEEIVQSKVGVIDIGGKTTDSAVIFPGGGSVDIERSGSANVGVLMLSAAVGSRLSAHFDIENMTPRMIDEAIKTGEIKIAGEKFPCADIVNAEKEKLTENIMTHVRSTIRKGDDLDLIIFVGGGAIVLKEQLANKFKQARFPEAPEFANARGMLKIAKYVNETASE